MTKFPTVAREMPLDDLVMRVYHLELTECCNGAEFKQCVRLILRNLDEVMDALICYRPADRRIRRAVSRLRMNAIRLRELCSGVPETFDHPEQWRAMAVHIIANYDQFRFEAGLLYQMAVPDSSFGVLRAAL